MKSYVTFYRLKENQKSQNRIVEYILHLVAHNGSGFDSYVVLNNLPQWRSIVDFIKNGDGIVSLKIFNGYVDENKKNTAICSFQMLKSSY